MNTTPKIYKHESLGKVVAHLRDDLNSQECVLLFAHNGTGKTRLSMEFRNKTKKACPATSLDAPSPTTLYFNAFTEDLFTWNNDLEADKDRYLNINSNSKFFNGLKGFALEKKIDAHLKKYTSFDFDIDYVEWKISFRRGDEDNIKISRGEERLFIWCFFLVIYELAIDGAEAYQWVDNVYIDDPISSLDDNNAIAVAVDLARLLERGKENIRVVISTHHSLFHNVLWNEINRIKLKRKSYFYNHPQEQDVYTLRSTGDTPFFHHIAILAELKKAVETDKIYTYHFNALRNIMEKTATFFGQDRFQSCISGIENEVLFSRAVNLMSHGGYSIYEPVLMVDDNKNLFKQLFNGFLKRYKFELPEILKSEGNGA